MQKPNKISYSAGNTILSVLLKVLVIFIELSVIGGAVALITRIWDPSWNPMRPTPESTILKSWENLKIIESQNFNSELSISGKNIKTAGSSSGDFDASLKVSGGADFSDKNNILSVITFSADLGATDGKDRYDIAVAAETREISKDFYLKINQLNLGGLEEFLMMFGLDASKLENQWIKFNLKDGTDIAEHYVGLQAEEGTESQKYYEEMAGEILKVLLNKKVYDINEFSDNQGAEGKEYHYAVSLSREKFVAALPDVYNILKKYSTKVGIENYEQEYSLQTLQEEVNSFFDKVGVLSVNLFIGKEDGFFHKIQFYKSFDLSKADSQSTGLVQIDYKIEQSGINKPIEVAPPSEYKTFEEIFEGSASVQLP
jgi:hypothetical protein